MEAPNLSMLPLDILRSLFERLSFVDFHRAKMICSKQTVPHKSESPWLILFTDNGGCVLYNPDEDKIYRNLRDFSTRFLANSDVFSERRIVLPPLEKRLSTTCTLNRVGDEEFKRAKKGRVLSFTLRADTLRGFLWVDEKTEEYVVVYFFDSPASYLSFCKKGDDYYTYIPLRLGYTKLLTGLTDLVLRGYHLYILTTRCYIQVLDFSGQNGFVDLTESNPYQMCSPRSPVLLFNSHSSIAVTTAGEVLLVESLSTESQRGFHHYKKDPNLLLDGYHHELLEVDSLGDEALLLDLGITVPANRTLGIKPNSIYFTRHNRACLRMPCNLDICVCNLASKTVKRFSDLANMNLKDARWFLPLT